jgi:hypothetical protein
MRIPRFLVIPFYVLGAIVGVYALVAIAWDSLGTTTPVIAAYCKVDGFSERTYSTFEQCDASLEADIRRFGYVCGCGRIDGLYRPATRIAQWFL